MGGENPSRNTDAGGEGASAESEATQASLAALADHAEYHLEHAGADCCVEGEVRGADSGMVTRGRFRFLRILHGHTDCFFVELNPATDSGVSPIRIALDTGGNVIHGDRDLSEIAAGKLAALSRPANTRPIDHEAFFQARQEAGP